MSTKTRMFALAALAFVLSAGSAPAENTRKIDRTIPAAPGQKIDIRGFSGSTLRCTAWDRPEISIHLEVTVSGLDGAAEQALLDSIRVDAEPSDNRILVTFVDPGKHEGVTKSFWEGVKAFFKGTHSFSRDVTGEIRVPARNDLDLRVPYTNIQIEGVQGKLNVRGSSNTMELNDCAAVEHVENNYGKTKILKSGGTLLLETQSGTVEVEEFKGEVECRAPYSRIRMTRIARRVAVNGQSANLNIAGVGGDVTIDADYSPITVADVTGTVDVKSQSSTLRIRNADGARVRSNYSKIDISGVTGKSSKDLPIESQSGTLSIEDVTGNLTADIPYSSLSIKGLRGSARLGGQSIRVHAREIAGDWESDNEYSTIDVQGLAARTVKARNSSGALTFGLVTVPEMVTIKNMYAGATVTLPRGFEGEITLEAEYGSIDTSFPVSVTSGSGSARGSGKIGSGNGSISIETTSGKIQLQQK